jgi:2-polyprenyl-3-methyl-5-hydroxy-6-metoxy-1,4-benzoquinol methylase
MPEQDLVNHLFNQNAEAFSQATEQHVTSGTYQRGQLFIQVLKKYCPGFGMRVLDYGCGTGRMSIMAAEEGFLVKAVDPAEEHIKIANGLNRSTGVEFNVLSDKLDEASSSFDAVVSSSVFEFVPDPKQYIDDIHKVLKPKGVLLISVPNTNSWWRWYAKLRFGKTYDHFKFQKNVLSQEGLRLLVEKKGFKKIGSSLYFESAFDEKGFSALSRLRIFGTLSLMVFIKQ